MSAIVNPREIEEAIARVLAPSAPRIYRPPVFPKYAGANEYLYGVPIFVFGEGVRGQYVRHSYVDREGVRYWLIEYGVVNIYGVLSSKRFGKGMSLPLVILGLPTHYARMMHVEDFENFLVEEVVLGYMEVEERRILNLDRVSRGLDPVMIVDLYGIFTSPASTPSELIDRLVEASRAVEALQRAVWEYEKRAQLMETNLRMAQAEVNALRALLQDLQFRFEKLASENTQIYSELVRLREELKVRGREVAAGTETAEALISLVNRVVELIGELVEASSKSMDEARTAYERALTLQRELAARAAEKTAAQPPTAAPSPPPPQEEETGGEEREEAE
ncbi:MAG: hypothetical protein QXU97_06155 [Fervidicoccaceae archaeon]